MKILVTTPTFHPCKGGAESFLQDLLQQFANSGHEVTVLTGSPPTPAPLSEYHHGIRILRIPYPSNRFNQFHRSFSILRRMRSIVRTERIDVVLAGLIGMESVLLAILHPFLKFKLVVVLHGSELRSYIRKSRPVRWALRRILKVSQTAIAVSEALKKEAISFEPSVAPKIFTVPCGISTEAVRQAPPMRRPERYVLYVGRLHPVKDIPTLLKAFRAVSAEIPGVKLYLAGTGSEEMRLKEMIGRYELSDRVIFLGAMERTEIFQWLRGCEALVLPSFSEGCPVTVIEALAAGKVVIASRVTGITEILNDRENGILFEKGNSEELAHVVKQILSDPQIQSQMEDRIKTLDLSVYEIANVARKHSDLYLSRSKSLHVCLISAGYGYDENCGGPSTYYDQLNRSLLQLGVSTSIITSRSNSHKAGNEILVGPGWTNMTGRSSSFGGARRLCSRLLFSYRAYRAVKRLEAGRPVDVVVAPELFAQGLFVALFMPHKLITRIHAPTVLVDRWNNRNQFAPVSRLLNLPEKFQAKKSAALTVATNFLARQIQREWKIPRESIHILPTGIDVTAVRNLGINGPREIQGRYLLYFGRLEKLKGVEVLSAALKLVFQKCPEIKMIWIGRDWGSKAKILADLSEHSGQIEIHDTMQKERLFPIVFHADLVILPSLFENFSNAGLEAMSLERPVIATHHTGFSEMIQNEVDGFLVEPGNRDELAAKIMECLGRRDLSEIGRRAYESVLAFDSANVSKQVLEFFTRPIGTRH